MNDLINKIINLRKKKFIKDIAVLQVGSVFSSVILFLGSVVLAQFLGPDLYGQYALIFAFVSLVNLFTNWGEKGVALTLCPESYAKKDVAKFKEVLVYYFTIIFLSTLLVGVIAIPLAPWLTGLLYHNQSIGQYARVVLVMTIVQLFFLFFIAVLQITRKVKYLTVIESTNKILHVIASVSFVVIGFGLWGFIYGKLLAAIIFLIFSVVAYSIFAKRNKMIPSLHEMVSLIRYKVIKKYFRFSISISLDKNIGSLFGLIPIFLLGYFGTTEQVSFYKIGYAYITLPFMLFSPVSKLLAVQLPQSKAYGKAVLSRDFWRSTFFSGGLTTILVLMFAFLAHPLVSFFYGEEFIGSVRAAYLLSVVAILSGFGIGFSSLLKTIRKMRYSIIINILTVIVQLLVFFVLFKVYNFDVLIAVIISLISLTVFNMILVFGVVNRFFKLDNNQSSV